MLASEETVRTVASALRRHTVPFTVVDPVCCSTSGVELLPPDAVHALREELLSLTTVLTANIPEAQLLLKSAGQSPRKLNDFEDFISLAQAVQKLGPRYVLLKGGHLPLIRLQGSHASRKEILVNVLYGDGQSHVFESKHLGTKNTHGTGCSLASAIACCVADGMSIEQAVQNACRYVEAGIRASESLGRANGPIDYFHSTYTLPFAPGRFVEYVLERDDVKGPWKDHTGERRLPPNDLLRCAPKLFAEDMPRGIVVD